MKTSLNQALNSLQEIADNHAQLKGSFIFCDVADLEAKNDLKYPLLWADVTPASFGTKTISLNLQLTCIDMVSKDLINERDVLSDTLQILSDVITIIRQEPDYFNLFIISESAQASPIKDHYQDEVAGWVSNISLEIENAYNACIVPTI
jgi:hypothetical protein